MGWIKRNSERKRLHYPATIYRQDRSLLYGCTVRDISDTGARLKIDKEDGSEMVDIPQQFFLSFTAREDVLSESLSVTRSCQTVWVRKDKDEVGVKFLNRCAPR